MLDRWLTTAINLLLDLSFIYALSPMKDRTLIYYSIEEWMNSILLLSTSLVNRKNAKVLCYYTQLLIINADVSSNIRCGSEESLLYILSSLEDSRTCIERALWRCEQQLRYRVEPQASETIHQHNQTQQSRLGQVLYKELWATRLD